MSGLSPDLIALETALVSLAPSQAVLIGARFGVGGHEIRSMKQLHADTGLSRADLRASLGSGLTKLRTQLT